MQLAGRAALVLAIAAQSVQADPPSYPPTLPHVRLPEPPRWPEDTGELCRTPPLVYGAATHPRFTVEGGTTPAYDPDGELIVCRTDHPLIHENRVTMTVHRYETDAKSSVRLPRERIDRRGFKEFQLRQRNGVEEHTRVWAVAFPLTTRELALLVHSCERTSRPGRHAGGSSSTLFRVTKDGLKVVLEYKSSWGEPGSKMCLLRPPQALGSALPQLELVCVGAHDELFDLLDPRDPRLATPLVVEHYRWDRARYVKQ